MRIALSFGKILPKIRSLFLFVMLFSFMILPSTSIESSSVICQMIQINKQDSSSTDYFDGYNIYILERKDSHTSDTLSRTLLITDLDGKIFFQRNTSIEGSMSTRTTEFINSTTILYGDREGAYLWNLETNVTRFLNFDGHHDYEVNLANNTFFALLSYDINIGGIDYNFDKIREFDVNGSLVWEKDTRDFINHNQWCPYEDGGDSRDITHTNSISYDEQEDVLFVNTRNVNTFYKIDHKTGEMLWGAGEYGNFTNYDIRGNEVEHLFFHSHALKIVRDNTFLCFGNDRHNQTDATSEYSRLLEIYVDEDAMCANITWEWISSPDYHCEFWGDHDLMPNNNRFGIFGSHGHTDTDLSARLVEVDYGGNIVWEYDFPGVGVETFGIYQGDRFRFTPTVSEPNYYDFGENNSYFEWDVWFNFFSKTNYTGTYYLLIDNEQVETGSIIFPRFWQPTNVRYYTDSLNAGEHNISLVVADEVGHLSNESDFYASLGLITFGSFISLRTAIELVSVFGILTPSLIGIIIWFSVNQKIHLPKIKK